MYSLTLKKYRNILSRLSRPNLFSLFHFADQAKVLDLSCGNATALASVHQFWPSLELHGIDMSPKDITYAVKNYAWGTFAVGRAEELPYNNNEFDYLVCSMSLHHYDKPKQAFSEIARVLAPNGRLYLIDFIPQYRWSQWLNNLCGCPDPYHFEKYYTAQDVEKLAAAAGLSIVEKHKPELFSGQKLLILKNSTKQENGSKNKNLT